MVQGVRRTRSLFYYYYYFNCYKRVRRTRVLGVLQYVHVYVYGLGYFCVQGGVEAGS